MDCSPSLGEQTDIWWAFRGTLSPEWEGVCGGNFLVGWGDLNRDSSVRCAAKEKGPAGTAQARVGGRAGGQQTCHQRGKTSCTGDQCDLEVRGYTMMFMNRAADTRPQLSNTPWAGQGLPGAQAQCVRLGALIPR